MIKKQGSGEKITNVREKTSKKGLIGTQGETQTGVGVYGSLSKVLKAKSRKGSEERGENLLNCPKGKWW